MIVLAVDTSTSSCSVALMDGDRLLAEEIYTSGKTHSRHLMAIIQKIVARCKKSSGDIQGIAVTKGPGTFTGLRIGLSTVKGLAAAIQVPVVGVGSLAALAYPLRFFEGEIVSMIDARRGEVYHACYQGGTDSFQGNRRIFVSVPDTVMEKLSSKVLVVGSGALCYRHLFESTKVRYADPAHHVIRASSVGLLALKRFNQNDVDDNETLTPEYIRKSDAQIQFSKKN